MTFERWGNIKFVSLVVTVFTHFDAPGVLCIIALDCKKIRFQEKKIIQHNIFINVFSESPLQQHVLSK